MQAVIPIMRKQRGGIILNITSLGGRASFSLNSPYHATKFTLEGLSESIQYELEPFGIKIIEPGDVGSNLKMSTKMTDPFNSPYRLMQSSMSEYLKQWARNTIHPSGVRIKKKYVRQGISKLDEETD